MKNKLAMLLYRLLIKYCESHKGYCKDCIFDDYRPRCGCIANIPIEWYEPKK